MLLVCLFVFLPFLNSFIHLNHRYVVLCFSESELRSCEVSINKLDAAHKRLNGRAPLNHDHTYIKMTSVSTDTSVMKHSENVRKISNLQKNPLVSKISVHQTPKDIESIADSGPKPRKNERHFGLTCHLCSKVFDNRVQFMLHRNQHARNSRAFKCEVCLCPTF